MGSLKPTAQGFICFLTGDAVRDNEIVRTTQRLDSWASARCRTMVVNVTEKPGAAADLTRCRVALLLEELADEKDGNTRLDLNGHGDHHHDTIGGWKASDVSALLGGKVRHRPFACWHAAPDAGRLRSAHSTNRWVRGA